MVFRWVSLSLDFVLIVVLSVETRLGYVDEFVDDEMSRISLFDVCLSIIGFVL